jgi:hypothetical protein
MQYFAFAQPNGLAFSMSYTGYINSNAICKVRASANVGSAGYWNMTVFFHGEVAGTNLYPTRLV